jgi:hypothetical protein
MYVVGRLKTHNFLSANWPTQTTHVEPPRPNTPTNNRGNNNNRPRSKATPTDSFTTILAAVACIVWAGNLEMLFTGKLCQNEVSKVIFCGFPSFAVFFVWIAMLQTGGTWAISRQGKTEDQYRRLRGNRLAVMWCFMGVLALGLSGAMFVMCKDGCSRGRGDGQGCVKDNPLSFERVH